MRASSSTCPVFVFLVFLFGYRTCLCLSICQHMDSNYSFVCRFDSHIQRNVTADAMFDFPIDKIESLRLEFISKNDSSSIAFPFKYFFQLGFLQLRELFIVSDISLRDEKASVFQMDVLEPLPKLSKFSFHVMNVEIVPGNMSAHLKLRHLNVSYSRDITFGQLCKIVRISGPALDAIYAEGINDGDLHTFTGMLDDDFFSCFQNTSLRYLFLPESNIKIMSSPHLNLYFPSLELLDVSRNDVFIDLDTYLAILKLTKLKDLIASGVPFPKGKVAQICSNDKKIEHRLPHPFCEFFHNDSTIQYIQNLEVFNIGGSTDCKKINTFYCISQSLCTFPNNSSLRELYLDHNCIMGMDMLITGLGRLEKFDFSFNLCEYISSQVFTSMTSLTTLHLNGNSLSKMEKSDPFELQILFRQNHDLRFLNLSANGFSWLPLDMFTANSKLQVLDLSKNNLYETDWLTGSLVHLRSLNLSENDIRDINTQTRRILTDIASLYNKSVVDTTVTHVSLTGNPISCNCDQEDMLTWFANNRRYIIDIDGIVCAENAGFLSTYINDIAAFSNKCTFQRYKGLFALCAIPIIATVCVVLYIRHYRHILRIRRIREQLDQFVEDNFHVQQRFLVYLAYSFSDSVIVLTKIFPELESRLQKEIGVTENLVCISDRDFGVGVSISDEIIHAVSSSRAVLFILSKEFARSRWCEFEAEIALYHGKPIILVTLGDVNIRSLPNSLRKVCFKWTRLEWPVTDDQNKLEGFWKKLVNAIIKYTDDDVTLLNRNLV